MTRDEDAVMERVRNAMLRLQARYGFPRDVDVATNKIAEICGYMRKP
jgi:hypothetical protein